MIAGGLAQGSAQSSEVRESFHQEPPLRLLLRKPQGPLVGRPRVVPSFQPAEQVGVRGVGKVVVGEVAAAEDGVDQGEPGRRPVPHGHGHGAVQLHDRRRVYRQQGVVQRHDLPPVRGLRRRGARVDGGDGGLDGVRPEPAQYHARSTRA